MFCQSVTFSFRLLTVINGGQVFRPASAISFIRICLQFRPYFHLSKKNNREGVRMRIVTYNAVAVTGSVLLQSYPRYCPSYRGFTDLSTNLTAYHYAARHKSTVVFAAVNRARDCSKLFPAAARALPALFIPSASCATLMG